MSYDQGDRELVERTSLLLDTTFGDNPIPMIWGGKTVNSVMHGTMPLIPATMKVDEVLQSMTSGKFGCAIVLNEFGSLLGIVTDGDIRRGLQRERQPRIAADIMTWHPVSVPEFTPLSRVVELMRARQITQVVVRTEDMVPVGIVHIHDILRALP